MVAMGVAAHAHAHLQLEKDVNVIEGLGSKWMELKWVRRDKSKSWSQNENVLSRPVLPIYISNERRHADPERVRELYGHCNHSSHRFPNRMETEPLDIRKLRVALSHSAVVVSVFCKAQHMNDDSFCDFLTPVSPSRDQLVGFGRAVSDYGLTASIHDVMVIPSLRRMGIGQMIVKKIVRMLTNRDIYDIAALCSENERLFFKACGFGDDMLGSTTMMYTRTASLTGEQTVTRAGRKLLLVPPLTEGPHKSSRTII